MTIFLALFPSAKNFLESTVFLHIIHGCFHMKNVSKCVNLGRFLDFELPNTTFSWLKHMNPKSSQNDIFFVLNLKKFLLLFNPRNLPKTTGFTCSISAKNSQNNSYGSKNYVSKMIFFCFESKLRITVAVDPSPPPNDRF